MERPKAAPGRNPAAHAPSWACQPSLMNGEPILAKALSLGSSHYCRAPKALFKWAFRCCPSAPVRLFASRFKESEMIWKILGYIMLALLEFGPKVLKWLARQGVKYVLRKVGAPDRLIEQIP